MLILVCLLLWGGLLFYALHLFAGRVWAGWAGTGLAAGAWLALTELLATRGLAAGRWPLANRYEFALCFLWGTLTVQLLMEASSRERRWGAFGLVIALLVATAALTRPEQEQQIAPLVPALRSPWLPIHGLTATLAYGTCGVATGLALARLVLPARQAGARWPAGAWLERMAGRAVGIGFPWLTLSILSGAVWAEAAWGRYWGWDPKETWSLVVWLAYLLVLHLRAVRRWGGRRLAGVMLVAFGLLYFGFIGMPWLVRLIRLHSLHGF